MDDYVQTVFAKNFTPMRGHVALGTIVIFRDGTKLTISQNSQGWFLMDDAGHQIGQNCGHDANALTYMIVKIDDSK